MDRPPLYGQSPSAGFEPALTAREVIDGRPDLDRGSTVMFRCTCQVAGYQPWVDVVSSTFLAPHGSIDPCVVAVRSGPTRFSALSVLLGIVRPCQEGEDNLPGPFHRVRDSARGKSSARLSGSATTGGSSADAEDVAL